MKIVSFNIWDLPYWFVKNRQQRIVQIAAYLRGLDAEIVCLQESFDVHHRRVLYELLGPETYHVSGGLEATRKAPLAQFDTTGGLVIFSKFPMIHSAFTPFRQFTPSMIERVGRKGILEATLATPYGQLQVFNTHLHKEQRFFAHHIRLKQLKTILERMQHQAHLPVILAGDFNENALMEQKEITMILRSRGLAHSVHFEKYEYLPSYRLNNPLVDTWLNRVRYSRRLDYILVCLMEKLGLQVVQYEPIYLSPPLSDHDPVVLALSPAYK